MNLQRLAPIGISIAALVVTAGASSDPVQAQRSDECSKLAARFKDSDKTFPKIMFSSIKKLPSWKAAGCDAAAPQGTLRLLCRAAWNAGSNVQLTILFWRLSENGKDTYGTAGCE